MEDVVGRIADAVAAAIPDASQAMLAISGGVDSMVLLDAALSAWPIGSFRVATFDHASGPHSAAAVEAVTRTALRHGVSVIVGRSASSGRPSEASWRDDRLGFLRAAAEEHRSPLFTAHTRDDQIETVLFRELRGAGTRGLAGLHATASIIRPLLPITRSDIARYAKARRVEWVEDPSNQDRSFARNRIRHDLLPALRRRTPAIDNLLADVGSRAAAWRSDVETYLESRVPTDLSDDIDCLTVRVDLVKDYSDEALAIVWPALLARVGVIADWRGTRRLVEFTMKGMTGQRIQLSGGWVVTRGRTEFEVRQAGAADPKGESGLPFPRERHRTV